MAVNSRQKGKRMEREAVKACKEHLCAPEARRTSQVDGGLSADIINVFNQCHVEVKGHQKIGAMRFLDQALADMAPEDWPMVLMRENGGPWCLMIRVADAQRFVDEFVENLRKYKVATD